jgi:DMSO/TMAO reductase YedYZ molybdopterin-dependent catalytic subunit
LLQRASLAALAGLLVHYAAFWLFSAPLLTDSIAEWIMARTPSRHALWILDTLGVWAKPFAATGGLATLGAMLWIAACLRKPLFVVLAASALALGSSWLLEYTSWPGALSFWFPASAALVYHRSIDRKAPRARREADTRKANLVTEPDAATADLSAGASTAAPSATTEPQTIPAEPSPRRSFLLSAVMASGTAAVAIESYLRNEALARTAIEPVPLDPFTPPVEKAPFAPPLVRPAVTPVSEFYGMSKNTVDPVIDPNTWRLRLTIDGKPLRQYRYSELLALPRTQRYVTLRCISNTLRSNLMGNALWSGVHLGQLADRAQLPPGIVEVAVIGVDGHGDSYPLDYAFSEETLLALGMNGKTLNRTHGFPIRLLVPRYFGFKNVKWIGEIRFVTQPYYGTWPKMGYTKEAYVHTFSYIDRILKSERGLEVGGIALSGNRGIRRVQIRAGQGEWIDAELEGPLSPYAWTRWRGLIPIMTATTVEARAQDGLGNWQATEESPLFPSGVAGPTIRKV